MCEKQDRNSIKQLEERILKVYPNTYTFTKNLAEQIVASNSNGLPVAIVRPSIIGASLEEPCPGWLDNIYGLTSIFYILSIIIVFFKYKLIYFTVTIIQRFLYFTYYTEQLIILSELCKLFILRDFKKRVSQLKKKIIY